MREAQRTRGSILVLLAVWLQAASGAVVVGPDGKNILIAPFTDDEHIRVCPALDVRVCPILVMDNPVLVVDGPAENGIHLQTATSLSQTEQDRQASVPFRLYNLKDDNLQKRYLHIEETFDMKISFTFTEGVLFFAQQDYLSCNVTIVAETANVLGRVAGPAPGETFSLTAPAQQINCLLDKLHFQSSRVDLSSEAMLAKFGTLPSLRIRVENAVASSDLDISFEITTLIYYEKVVTPVVVDTCPSVTYDAPPPPLQWTRSDLETVAAPRGLQCLTAPISQLAAAETSTCETVDGTYSCFSCGSSLRTFLYVFEDSTEPLTLTELEMEDVNSIYAIVSTSFVLSFQGSAAPVDDARTVFEAVGVRFTDYCDGCTEERADQLLWKYCAKVEESQSAQDAPFEGCASRTEDAFNTPWVPTTNQWLQSYNIVVRATTPRASMCVTGTRGCVDCGQTADLVGASRYCPCTNGICFALNDVRSSSSGVWFDAATGARKARLWFDVVPRGREDAGVSLQDGFFDLSLLQQAPPDDNIWRATGWLYARPSANSTLDWFKVAPMIVEEAYYNADTMELFFERVVSDPNLNKEIAVRVRSHFGELEMPSAGGATRVSAQELLVSANLRDANNAISQIRYTLQTPPNYNSQTNRSGSVDPPDLITVSFDKTLGNDGLVDTYGVGQVSATEFPVHVIAVNDPPFIVAPALAEAVENQIAPIAGVSVEDADADEVLLTEAGLPPSGVCPLLEGEVEHLMTLSMEARNGSVFVNTTGVKAFTNITVISASGFPLFIQNPSMGIMEKLMRSYGDIRCGLDGWYLCVDIGTEADPRGRRRDTVFVGVRKMSFIAAKPCINHALAQLRYRGQQDYNNNVPAAPPSDRRGCLKSEDDLVVGERIFIQVSDNGHTGCQSGTALTATKEIAVSVASVTQDLLVTAPTMAMAVEDVRLAFTSHRCQAAAEFPLQQRRCGAIQVLSRDNGDLSLLEREFRMSLQITMGQMTLGKSDGLQFLEETSGTAATRMVFDGRLCACNQALETLSVVMEPGFNTDQANLVNGEWRNDSVLITLDVEQLPHPETGAPGGAPASHVVPIHVRGTDDGPTLTLLFPPEARRTGEALEISSAFADIYLCGGRVPCQCPPAALACIEVEDADSCEAKWRQRLPCDAAQGSLAADARLSARTHHGSLWFFPKASLACDPLAAVGEPTACVDNVRAVTAEAAAKISTAEAGTMLLAVDVVAPLPELQGGLLRVWASSERYGKDSLNVTVRGGRPLPGVVQEGADPIQLELLATACAAQEKALCIGAAEAGERQSDVEGTSLPGYGVILVGLVVASAVGICLTALCSQRGLGKLEHGSMVGSKEDAIADLGHKMQQVASNAQDSHWVATTDNRHRTYWYRSDTHETTWRDPTSPQQGSRLQLLLEKDSVAQSFLIRPGMAEPAEMPEAVRRRQRFEEEEDEEEEEDAEISDRPAIPSASEEEMDFASLDNAKVTGMLLTRSQWMAGQDNGMPGVEVLDHH